MSVKAAIYPSRTIKMLSAPHILSLVKVGDDAGAVVIINNVVYCLRCIVQVHVVNQKYLMFIYYLYLIINDIYTW